MTWLEDKPRVLKRSLTIPMMAFALLYLVLDVLIHPQNAFHTHHLADPDDYMRLNEVVNWLRGQGWYDLSQPRLSPLHHTIIHWSRLVDLPIYGAIRLLSIFLPFNQAVLDASFLIPPLTYILFLWCLGCMGRLYTPKKTAFLTLLFLPLVPNLLFHFTPGKVDHHGYELIIAAFTLSVLPDILFLKKASLRTYCAGIFMAAGLWIGTEILPFLISVLFVLAIFCPARGGKALSNFTTFTGSLFFASMIFLMIARPPSEWGDRSISWFSLAAVLFSFFTFLATLITHFLSESLNKAKYRVLLSMLLSSCAGICFIIAVPHLTDGAFANYDDFNATIALDNITEAMPLRRMFSLTLNNRASIIASLAGFLHYLFLPLLALCMAYYQAYANRGRSRVLWISSSILLTIFLGFSFFYQQRLFWYLSLIMIPVLAGGSYHLYQRYRLTHHHPTKLLILSTAFIILSPFGSYALSSLFLYFVPLSPDNQSPSCDLEPILPEIQNVLGSHPITIMAPFDEGPELLLFTPYNVIGANFNVSGNVDVYQFFRSRDESRARSILQSWQADVVLICRQFPAFFSGQEHLFFGENAFLKTGDDGRLHIVSSLTKPTLIEELASGRPPSWLQPIVLHTKSGYLLYKVIPWDK